jgi:cytochrome c oxidase cbb3-type subunit 3
MKPSVFYKSIGVAASIAASSVLWSAPGAAMGPKIAAAEQAAEEQQAQQPVKKVPSSNPLSGDPEAIELGRQLYFTWCVQCHGHKANGESRFGKYAGDLTRFWRGYKEFVVIVQNGRTDKMMPPWKTVLDVENISKVGAFLETLAVEGANWK